ncbi:MAG: zinc ribbon domain-containing protein, partial [Oscillospiraceae bacterium]|nr:zinc ribbon domain-containing protein [Oscillospiraceae bacterium]
MICHNCGQELENDSIYCKRCGANQYDPSAPPQTVPRSHPYKKLGGFLKFFIVVSAVGVAANILTGFSSLRETDVIVDSLKLDSAGMNALLVLEKILFGVNLILCLFVIKQIVQRAQSFLLIFELFCVSSVAVNTISSVITLRIFSGEDAPVARTTVGFMAAISLAEIVLWLIYFR